MPMFSEIATEVFQDLVQKMTDASPCTKDDYIEDGLLHCGKCHTPKECVITWAGTERKVPVTCRCRCEKIREIETQFKDEERKAWPLVWEAICKSSNEERAKEEFEKLPPSVQKLVGCAKQLREWRFESVEALLSVIRPRFQREYHAVSREKCRALCLSPFPSAQNEGTQEPSAM